VEQKLKIRRNNKEFIEIDNDKTSPVVMNMTDCAGLQYDWRLRLSRLNMTDFDLAKYDWRRRECDGGPDDYPHAIMGHPKRKFLGKCLKKQGNDPIYSTRIRPRKMSTMTMTRAD
jgi:hypothetical protein